MLPNFGLGSRGVFKPVEAGRQRPVWESMAALFRCAWPSIEGIVAVPGNHDFCDYAIPGLVESFDKYEPQTIQACGLKISGFRGIPWMGGYWDGEFGSRYFDMAVSGLEPAADIVLTHVPCDGILDQIDPIPGSTGSVALAQWFIDNPSNKRRLHAFGHIHEHGGEILERHGVCYSNAAQHFNLITLGQ